MQILGHLAWWTVGNASHLSSEQLERIVADLGIQAATPRPIVPIDAFRRLTGGHRKSYTLENGNTVMLNLHKATSQHTMLVRHIVRTVTDPAGITTEVTRVGDAAFYKPPRGQNHRARMRVTVFPESLADRPEIEGFAEELRREWDRALNYLDPQALRRLVRTYLSATHSLYLNGPYFMPKADDADRLSRLLTAIGGGSSCMVVPVIDDEPRRAMISDGLAAAALAGEVTVELAETYAPLGVVPESMWALLEKEANRAPDRQQ